MARKKKIKNKNLWFEPGELPKWVEEEDDLETRLGHYNNAKRMTLPGFYGHLERVIKLNHGGVPYENYF